MSPLSSTLNGWMQNFLIPRPTIWPYSCSFQRSLFVGLNNICFKTDSRIWQKSVSLKVSRRMKRMTRSSNLATRRFSKWFQTKTKNGAFHSSKLKRHLLKNWGQWTGSMLKSIKKSNEEIENGFVTFVVYTPISLLSWSSMELSS